MRDNPVVAGIFWEKDKEEEGIVEEDKQRYIEIMRVNYKLTRKVSTLPTRKEETSGENLKANKGEISVSTISNCNLTINNDIDFVKNKKLWKNHIIMADLFKI